MEDTDRINGFQTQQQGSLEDHQQAICSSTTKEVQNTNPKEVRPKIKLTPKKSSLIHFSIDELKAGIKALKENKATGLGDMRKHFGTKLWGSCIK